MPEALCRFGEPLHGGDGGSVAELAGAGSKRRLTGTMDALAADAIARDPHRFELLLRGRSGVGGVYDLLPPGARRCSRASASSPSTAAARL